MTARASLIACCAVLGALPVPATAAADERVAELERDTPISAYGGALAWSTYDPATQRYSLTIRQGDGTAPARAATATHAFDVSLGPDSRGRVVALYTRCRIATRGCDVYRYDLRTRRESMLRTVSSPSFDEAWPAQWRGRIAFARRARTRVVDGYDHRPDPRGRGPLLDCDIPYVKTITSGAPSRRLDRSHCGETTGIAIRRETIVQTTDVDQGGAGSESDVRRIATSGGAARILARSRGGEGGYSPFVSPSLSSSYVWLTRTGQRQQVRQGFVRIDLRSRRLTTVPAHVNLAGRVARDEQGDFWYVQGPEPHFDYHGDPPFCRSQLEPCRLVRASASPFSAIPRTLLARLHVAPAAGNPPVLQGELRRTIVRGAAVAGSQPVAGVALQLLRTPAIDQEGPFAQTGLTATSDAAGRFSFAPPPASPRPAYTVFAAASRIASRAVALDVPA